MTGLDRQVRPKSALWLLVAVFVTQAVLIRSAEANQHDFASLFLTKREALVRLEIEGSDPQKNAKKPAKASGFILFSDPRANYSIIITAAHVVGRDSHYLLDDDGRPVRRIWVDVRERGGLRRLPDPAQVLFQDNAVDVAVLAIVGSGYPTLKIVYGGIGQYGQIMALGFPSATAPPIPDRREGTGQAVLDPEIGLAILMGSILPEGMSGGPLINAHGDVLGIASRNRPLNQPMEHRAALASNVIPLLQRFISTTQEVRDLLAEVTVWSGGQAPISPIKKMNLVYFDGRSAVTVAGSGSGATPTRTVSQGLGALAEIQARGSESSECNPGSGRTFSQGLARGRVERADHDSLRFFLDLGAQGGHYRTAAACIGGNPVGLTGHDTETSATVELEGVVRLENTAAKQKVVVQWSDFVPGVVEISGPAGFSKNFTVQGGGEQTIELPAVGEYSVSTSIKYGLDHRGAGGPKKAHAEPRLKLILFDK